MSNQLYEIGIKRSKLMLQIQGKGGQNVKNGLQA